MSLSYFRNRTIARDLTIGLVATVVFVFISVSFGFVLHSQKQLNATLEEQSNKVAYRLAKVLAAPMWNLDEHNIEEIGHAFAEIPEISHLTIYNDQRETLYTYQEDVDLSFQFQRDILYEGSTVGSFDLGFSSEVNNATINKLIAVILALLIGVALTVILAIVLLLNRYLKRPMMTLTQGLENIALGDFNYRLPDQSLSDMQGIADAINALAETVHHRDERLQRAKSELERRVTTRTGELLSTNEQLRHEVTIRRLTEDQLRDAKDAAESGLRARSQFLAMMSHEIRTPMNGVIGMTTLLQQTELNPEQHDFVTTIQQSGESLLTILNDILDFSKIEAGKIDLEQHPTSVRMAIDTVLQLYQQQAQSKNLILEKVIADDVPAFVLADPTRLRQVLANLISNAVKFTHKGVVRVSAVVQERHGSLVELVFAVQDSGIGIPKDKLDRLFEPFKQVDASMTRRYGGTGLGLSICKLLSDVWNGRMWVESAEGEGTTFFFTLPATLADVTAQEPEPQPQAIEATDPDKRRILVAEDNVVNQKVTRRLLENLGYTVDIAPNGVATLEALDNYPYEIVLMDVQMPEMDGVEATRRLRKRLAPDRQPRVIALTANAMMGDRERFLNEGMDDYLSKPLRLPELKRVLGIE